ncbi:MAG: OmpA family protein [Acidobacteriota bacterium]|nr:OmpA family protein [Acidobacteriota bacterium]
MRIRMLTVAILCCLPSLAFAQEDAEGGKDHPLLARMAGYYLNGADAQEFAAHEFTLPGDEMKKVEGRYWRLDYWMKEGAKNPGSLAIARNYTNALVAKKGRKVFESVEPGGGTATASMPLGDGRTLWVEISLSNGGEAYTLTIVEEAAMAQEIEVTAAWLAEQLAKTGSVALQGITFDTAKAVLEAASKTVLDQIGVLLKGDAALVLEIQGHTDNTGAPTANLTLSQQRAEAVKKYLVTSHAIAAARLTTAGFGDSRPVADNATEGGRARNRRVELHRK